MKKFRIIFVLLAGLLISCSPVIAQSLTTGVWRMQNPDNMNESRLLMFSNDGTFGYSVCNLSTGQTSFQQGKYELSGGQMTMYFKDGTAFRGRLNWISYHKLSMTGDGSSFPSYFAVVGTAEDEFMSNRLNFSSGSTYSNTTTHEYKSCYTCFGTGRCRVCGGTGIFSRFGYSSTCSACNGTGKCWECKGTGRRE